MQRKLFAAIGMALLTVGAAAAYATAPQETTALAAISVVQYLFFHSNRMILNSFCPHHGAMASLPGRIVSNQRANGAPNVCAAADAIVGSESVATARLAMGFSTTLNGDDALTSRAELGADNRFEPVAASALCKESAARNSRLR